MITLNNIRELILKQDNELENMLRDYFEQIIDNDNNNKSKDSISSKELENEFNRLLENGQIEEAKNIIEKYKSIYGENEVTYSMEGIAFVTEGDLENAYNIFLKGLQIYKDNIDLLFNMAYVNLLLGNNDECRKYCNECILYSTDEEVKNQVYEILNTLNEKIHTFITINLKDDSEIFSLIDNMKHKIINLLQTENINSENKYEQNGITIYETNNTNNIMEYLIRNNSNCTVIVNDIEYLKILENIKKQVNIIYYTNNNLYTDKSNYLNSSTDLYKENNLCNISNMIITNNISVYIFKKIIEERDNVLFINNNEKNMVDISDFINNYESIEGQNINSIETHYSLIDDEYKKILFGLVREEKSIDNCITLAKYAYEKYNTGEFYKIYIILLCKNKDYLNLVSTAINSEFCEEVYKLELVYLYNMEKYELIEFITYLSINLYKKMDLSETYEFDYKMANYLFIINRFEESYNSFISVLQKNDYLVNSPIVNRNISYLLYANQNTDYEKFYSLYLELLKSFNKEK